MFIQITKAAAHVKKINFCAQIKSAFLEAGNAMVRMIVEIVAMSFIICAKVNSILNILLPLYTSSFML